MQLVLTLACLDIKKAVDENGNMIEPELGFTTAIVR